MLSAQASIRSTNLKMPTSKNCTGHSSTVWCGRTATGPGESWMEKRIFQTSAFCGFAARCEGLVLARFLRCQTTGLFHPIKIQSGGRELSDFSSASVGKCNVKDLGSHHAANRAFVHG